MRTIASRLKDVGAAVLGAAAILLVVLAFAQLFGPPWPTDDTDLSERVRSGMKPLIDYGTGCHYLTTPGGGLTPRLDPSGKPICTGSIRGMP